MKKSALVGLGLLSFSTIIVFQNCANPQFEDSDFASSLSSGGRAGSSYDSRGGSTGSGGGVVNIPSQGNSYTGGTNWTYPPGSNSGGTTSPGSVSSGSSGVVTTPSAGGSGVVSSPTGSSGAAASVDCLKSFNHMAWHGDLNQAFNVELSGFDSMDTSGAQEIFSHGGFGIRFESKPRPGVPSNELYSVRGPVASSGLSFRLVDIHTKKVVEVVASDYGTSSVNAIYRHLDATFYSSPKGTSVGVALKRDFYDRYKSVLGYVQVEMYCSGKLIARGIQDFKSLDVPMTKKLVKVSDRGYDSAVPGTGFVKLNCPLEVAAGSKISCTSSGVYISSRSYEVNYVKQSKFDNLAEISYANAPAGVHYIQTKVKYKSGIEDRSQLRTIRVK